MQTCVKSLLYFIEGQKYLSVCFQQKRLWVVNNRHSRLFARRHLEAGQYVAQSGLHLHLSETHSCVKNQKARINLKKCRF
jgi:hypothetical protein